MSAIPDNAALADLESILAQAYAVVSGHQDLNAVIEPAVGINVLRDLATEFTRMKDVAHALRTELVARGPGDFVKCIDAIYVSLPGCEPLRTWMLAHQPVSAALVPEDDFQRERPLYLERRRAGQQELAISGFDALKDARGNVYVAEEIARFRDRLREATRQLQRLNGYKQLHDALHGIQTRELPQLGRFLLKPELDAQEVREIRLLHGQLAGQAHRATASVRMFLDDQVSADEKAWLPELEAAVAPLKSGELDDPETLRAVVFDLRGLLRLHLPRLNRLLVVAAGAIPYDHLSDLLLRAAARAEAEGSPLEGRFEDAGAALDEIGQRLERKVAIHGAWQDLDVAVWAMEGAVRTAADPDSRRELASIWKGLAGRFDSLAKLDPAGIDQARALGEEFGATLTAPAPNPDALATAFADFARVVRQDFYQIDTALLEECAAVAQLEPTLRLLFEGGD